MILTLTEEQARALLDFDSANDEPGNATAYPYILLGEVQGMTPEQLHNWSALWQCRAAD